MAIAINGTVGSVTSNTSGTTLATTFTAAQSGKFSLFCLAWDPSGNAVPTVSVADSAGNTWTALFAQYTAPATTTAGGGVITQIFYSNTATSATTTTVTATFTAAITAKIGRLFTFTGTRGATSAVRNTVRGTASDITSSLTNVAVGDLVLAWGVWEQTGGSISATSTTTNGTWVPTNTTVTSTSIGSGAAGLTAYYQYKITTTAVGTQAHTVQNNSSGQNSLQYIKILQATGATVSRTATGSGTSSSSATGLETLVRSSYDNAHSDAIAAASIPTSAPYQLYNTVMGAAANGFNPKSIAQQFTAASSSTIDKVQLIISYAAGTSAGKTISVQIASDDIINGNNPPDPIPGTVIATSNSILETTIGSNATNQWISFTFPSAVSLTAGTKYWIIVEPEASSTTAAIGVLHFTNYAYDGWSAEIPTVGWWSGFSNSDPASSSVMNFRVTRKNAVGNIITAGVTVSKTATGSGTGTSNNTIVNGLLRTGYGSGGASTGDTAVGLRTALRIATGNGNGSASVSGLIPKVGINWASWGVDALIAQ
jgi:hypothetical protein